MSWLFWPLAALLAALCAALLVHPLLRRRTAPVAEGPDRSDYDIGIYRDQLGEIERDRKRGVLNDAEAEAARLEVQRRLLNADRKRRPMAGPTSASVRGRGAKLTALLVLLLPPLGGMGLYLLLGHPDMPSLPRAERTAETQRAGEMREMTGQLQQRLEADPDDPRGWELLARARGDLGQWPEAAEAYREAIRRGSAERPDLHSALGEALTAASDGTVIPEARDAFETALELDPQDARARYYRALALRQEGELRAALDLWLDLAETTPADAGWRPLLREQITRTAEALEIPAADLRIPEGTAPASAPALSEEDRAAAEEMDPEEREAFVRSMVERLSERLEREPEDIDGWLRLVQARLVLGEPQAALEALRRAEPLVEDLPRDDQRRRAVDEGLRLLDDKS